MTQTSEGRKAPKSYIWLVFIYVVWIFNIFIFGAIFGRHKEKKLYERVEQPCIEDALEEDPCSYGKKMTGEGDTMYYQVRVCPLNYDDGKDG